MKILNIIKSFPQVKRVMQIAFRVVSLILRHHFCKTKFHKYLKVSISDIIILLIRGFFASALADGFSQEVE